MRYRVLDLSDTEYSGTLSLVRNEPQSMRRAKGKVRGNKREPRDRTFEVDLETGARVHKAHKATKRTSRTSAAVKRDILLQAAMGSIHTDDSDN